MAMMVAEKINAISRRIANNSKQGAMSDNLLAALVLLAQLLLMKHMCKAKEVGALR